MSSIDEIKARIDIVELVSETVKLRRSGKNYTGFCPFHPNTRTPAFVVFPDSGTWRCFGQCNEGGDIFKFVMKKEGWDFPEALKYLAERAGVVLQPLTPQKEAEAEEFERLRELLEGAATFYRHQLFHTPAGQNALDYLHKRGLNDPILETFGLGYAPDAWEALLQHLSARGATPAELLQAGLLTERESGGVYDRFRNRITFPIRDMAGRMTGFGARILDPNDVPKFLNSPQTPLFDKGRLLYGLDQARKPIRAQDQAVIVEGYLDVIALHQAGFTNTVSPMGTALTEDQVRLLKRFTRRIVLALDADAAGAKATLRGLELARQALDRSEELAFDARGLLRHEARLQADLRVTALPEGMDPDEVVNRDPQEWAHILEVANPIVVHVMETLARDSDLDDPKAKSEVAAQVLPLIEDVPNSVERDAYRQRLARLLKIDERILLGAQPAGGGPRRYGRRPSPQAKRAVRQATTAAINPVHTLEDYCLGILVARPDLLYLLDRSLQQAGLGRLDLQDFEHTDHQTLFRLVQDSLEQDGEEPGQYIRSHLPEALSERLEELEKRPLPTEVDQAGLIDDLMHAIMRLRLHNVTESLNQLRFLQEEVQQQGDLRAMSYQELVLQHVQVRDRLDRALHPGGPRR
jgi:DNA primase